jgi:hypothetical protein
MHWITDETKPSDLADSMVFLELGEDAGDSAPTIGC